MRPSPCRHSGRRRYRGTISAHGLLARSDPQRRPRARRRIGLPGPWARSPRPGGRRGLLQHRDDRLPGGPHGPLLRRADHHVHLPPHRKRRRERGGRRGRRAGRPRPGSPRRRHPALQLSGPRAPRYLAPGEPPGRHRRDRYPPAHPAHPFPGFSDRRHRSRRGRPRDPRGRGRGLAGTRRDGPRQGGDLPAGLHLGRDTLASGGGLRPRVGGEPPGGGGRLRGEEEHPAERRRPRVPRHRGPGGHRRR